MFLFYFQAFIILSQIINIFPKRMLVCQELGINQRQLYPVTIPYYKRVFKTEYKVAGTRSKQ